MRVRALGALTMAQLVETSKTIWFVTIDRGVSSLTDLCVVCKGSLLLVELTSNTLL
jgi:hypothetical protein